MRNQHTPRGTAVADSLPLLLSIEGIAEHLGVSVRHIRRLVSERRIPYVKWGHLLRFDPDEIAEWLDGQRVAPTAPRLRRRY
jgi:excisionase family DNA binding protein